MNNKDELLKVINKYVGYAEQEIYDEIEEYSRKCYNEGVTDSLGTAVKESAWITDKIVESILKLKK